MIIVFIRQAGRFTEIGFDDGEIIRIRTETHMKYGLRKNDEVDESIKVELMKANDYFVAKESAFYFLGRRMHARKELELKLLKKKISKEIINDVLNELILSGYIDDEKFALEYAKARSSLKKIGVNKIKAELSSKGVERKIIENSIAMAVDKEITKKNAIITAKKKMDSLRKKGLMENVVRQKAAAFLLSKGYEYELIQKVLEKKL